ncbi:MAG: MarR family transcriptional regulator [Anaerolineaceae bacterium]
MPTHFKGTVEEELALNNYIKLTRAADSINNRLYAAGQPGNLTISQFGTLEALYHLGPLCQNVIGSKLLKSNSNMTTVIDNLEKRGLLRRERSKEDRRNIIVSLTEEGSALITKIFPTHLKNITHLFSGLTREELETLENLLRKLGKSAQS